LVRAADILHLHWIAYFVDQKSFFMSVRGRPIVWTLHDMNPFTGGCHFAGPCNKFATYCFSCPQLGSRADEDLAATIWRRKRDSYKAHDLHVVAPSGWLAQLARKSSLLGNTPISVIPYGLSETVFAARDKAASRALLGLPVGKMLVLTGGVNLNDERKGWRYLDAALTILSTRMNPANIGLLVFGRPPDLTQLENRGLNVYPLGSIKDERLLSAAYSAADLFVVSSMEDNLPNTVLEAMACSVPVVGFDSGGIPEMVHDGDTGSVVARRDTDGLAQSIQWLLERSEARREMGRRAREAVLRDYTSEIQAKRYLELYQGIADEQVRRTSQAAEQLS
jgi:glycosyltransferase involved in cell wall biosynthesis